VSEVYSGRQFVGMDLHRRRSVLVRMTAAGEHLETVRILNDRDSLADVMSRAGQSPAVVLEATYGWYWAADAPAELGATVHLAHPLGVKAFSYRRDPDAYFGAPKPRRERPQNSENNQKTGIDRPRSFRNDLRERWI
jgi:transposase